MLDVQHVLHGHAAEAPTNPSRVGYTFDSWSVPFNSITGNLEVVAAYTANDYLITLNVNGGNPLTPSEIGVKYDSAISGLPVPTKDGYTFVKWVDGNNLEYKNGDIYHVVGNITLTAVWELNDASYKVTHYLENLAGVYELDSTEVIASPIGKKVNAEVKTYTGFVFNSEHADNKLSGTVLSDNSLVLSVYYKREVYTVNFVDFNNTNLKTEEVKYLGAATAPADPVRVGYTFTGWSVPFNSITSDLEVVAEYNINSYTLTFNVDGGGAIDPQTHEYNTLVTLPIPTKGWHDFDGWLLESQVVTEVYLTHDMTVTATWSLTNYTITLNSDGGSAVENLTVQYGSVVSTLPTPTRLDYTFDGWTHNGVKVVLPYTFTESNDIEFKASWIGLSAGIIYEILDNSYVRIISYVGSETSLSVPSTILGYPVKVVGANAFKDNATLETLKFGSHVTTVENQAFYGMTSLTKLELPSSAQTFGTEVLRGSNALAHLKISGDSNYQLRYYFGNDVTYIPITLKTLEFSSGTSNVNIALTQNNLGSVEHVIIPNSVSQMTAGTFRGASGLTKLTIPFVGRSKVAALGDDADFGYIFGITNYSGSYAADGYYIPSGLVEVIITEAISIETQAFKDCSSLTSIEVPKTVSIIGDGAFSGCSGLTKLTLPFVGTSISPTGTNARFGYIFGTTSYVGGYEANNYYIPNGLSEVIITDTIGKVDDHAFRDCSSITSITLPNTVTSIGAYSFSGTGITNIEIPSDVTKIDYGAFWNCSSLTNITIPNGITSISNYLFYNCSSLASIEVPNSITSIGDFAFHNCGLLASIDIPSGVTNMGSGAFLGCSSITSIEVPNGVTKINNYTFYGCTSLLTITLSNNLTSIGDLAFYNCKSLPSIVIPNSVTIIGNSAFRDCTGLQSVTLPNSITSINQGTFRGCSNLGSITIPNNVTSIGYESFRDCINLTSITLSNSITSIGEDAFFECNSLTSITLPNSITSIGNTAFYNCGLTSIVIPNSVTSLGYQLFRACSNLSSITTPFVGTSREATGASARLGYMFGTVDYTGSYLADGYRIPNSLVKVIITDTANIGEDAFKNCSSITNITLPNNLTSIGAYAFRGAGIPSITIPSSMTTISNYAFSYCTSLTSIEIPSSVTSIGEYAFSFCDGFTNFTIPNSITSIGIAAFEDCHNLKSVIIPNSVTSIGHSAFAYCTSLTSITIPNSVTSIAPAFVWGCVSLTGIEIPNNITSIGNAAFRGCTGLTSIAIPNSVTNIGDEVFYGCTGFTGITIPNSVTIMGSSVFNGCSGLTQITLPFVGTSRETVYDPEERFGYIFGTTSYPGSYSADGYYIPNGLTKVTITDATTIGDNAFKNCSSITNITLSNSLTNVAAAAFWGCSGLTQMTLPFVGTSRTATGDGARFGHIFGTEYYPGSYEAFGYYIPNGLTEVIITDTSRIGGGAFWSCQYIKNITLPNNLTVIFYSAFRACPGLTGITIPNNVKTINDTAFRGVTFTTIVIPISVINMGYRVFDLSGNLTIFVEATSKPAGWDNDWNADRPVYWGGTWHYEGGIPVPNP
ncbi:MAG: leucine-rich repeat protein [Acholeplasmatales bacterium]